MPHYMKVSALISYVAASLLTSTACLGENKNDHSYAGQTHSADMTYTGSRDPAYLTMSNQYDFTLSLFENKDLADAVNITDNAPSTENCKHGGSVSTTALVNPTTGFDAITLNFTACRHNFVSQFDGKMKLTVDEYDLHNSPTRYTLSMADLLHTKGLIKNSLTGTIVFVEGANAVTSTANLYRFNHNTNTQYYLQNVKLIDGLTDSLSGRIYRSNDGYITLSSSPSLVTDDEGAPSQGQFYLHGADGSSIKMSKLSDPVFYDYVSTELDEDGDGTYEQQSLLIINKGDADPAKQ